MNYKLKVFLFGVFRPDFWVMLNHYNEDYDKFINRLLDEYDFTDIDTHTACLNGYKFWIENYPYSFMLPYRKYPWENCRQWPNNVTKLLRPSRYTCYRARKELLKASVEFYKTAS